MKRYLSLIATLSSILALGVWSALSAYPGGTPRMVTNAGPYCAVCHSSVGTDQVRDMAPEAAARMSPEARHFH